MQNDFVAALLEMREGAAAAEVSHKWRQLVNAVVTTAQPGALTLTIRIKPGAPLYAFALFGVVMMLINGSTMVFLLAILRQLAHGDVTAGQELVVLAIAWELYARWIKNPLMFPSFLDMSEALYDNFVRGPLVELDPALAIPIHGHAQAFLAQHRRHQIAGRSVVIDH